MSPADPCERVEVTAADGTVLGGSAHGGQVLLWRPLGGADRLWVSRDTGCGPGIAVRGGVPVCWPQFSDRGPLPKHGLVRDRPWQPVTAGVDADGAAVLGFVVGDDEATRGIWPQAFELRLEARALGGDLRLDLTVGNPGEGPLEFAAALHAYLRVADLGAATVAGLAGCRAEDNATGRGLTVPDGPLPVAGPLDLAVRDVPGPLTLADLSLGDLSVTADGLPDRVVWNPGPGLAPGDVHPGGEAEFVCIEPAALHPVTVAPGATWRGTARWTVRPPRGVDHVQQA